MVTTSRPLSASSGLVLTSLPTLEAVGWLKRMPWSSVTTTYSACVSRRTRSACCWSGPSGSGRSVVTAGRRSGPRPRSARSRARAARTAARARAAARTSTPPATRARPRRRAAAVPPRPGWPGRGDDVSPGGGTPAVRSAAPLTVRPHDPMSRTRKTRLCGLRRQPHKDGDRRHRLLRSCPMTQNTPAAGSPAIALRDATKRFPTKDGGTFTAIRDVTLDVARRRVRGRRRPTGCGKSTTLSLVSGLEPASSGEVARARRAGHRHPRRRRLHVPADAVLPWRTVLDNVALGPRYRGRRRRDAEAQGAATGSTGSG